ncbi:endonuclease [Novosphingobium sp. FSY-8]|uniref:Endonuclease n=1 Tax=Novosphingobium ovatum TaxID=1908523 RepID=A0ABW9XDB5_9SPHN|nr:S1/P1 nuclease [Novosphingobium ovatum]NBC36539.1 endonuclease [Novosphingobium ovatum]
MFSRLIATPVRRIAALVAAAALPLAAPSPALAWGEVGHHTVANIALANVSPATAAAIAELLKAEKGLGTPKCPVTTIAQAGYWPDCLRSDSWRWAYTFPWHYQDGEVTLPAFDIKANCPQTACVTAQIERSRRVLADKSIPAPQRLEALAFLTHFVGDLHQPLHAAEHAHDAGGNGVKVVRADGKIDSLHWYWDKDTAEGALALMGPPLVRAYSADDRAALATGGVEDWAKESWAIARDVVYPQVFGHAPAEGEKLSAPVSITAEQNAANARIARDRLTRAGLRLARLLDEALGQ